MPVGALSLAGAAVSSDFSARTIGVTNAAVSMGANLATAFNEAFAKLLGKANVFAAGDPLGTATLWGGGGVDASATPMVEGLLGN